MWETGIDCFAQGGLFVRIGHKKNIDHTYGFSVIKRNLSQQAEFETTIHNHVFFEIEIITGGRAVHEINGDSFAIGRGYVCLLMPNDFHTIHIPKNEKLMLYNITFLEPRVHNDVFFKMFDCRRTSRIEAWLDEASLQGVMLMCEKMLKEKVTQEEFSDIAIEGLLNYVIIEILRNRMPSKENHKYGAFMQNTLQQQLMVKDGQHYNTLMSEILRCIEKNLCSPNFSLTMLAETVNKNPRYISAFMKQNFGLSFSQYILKRRLDCSLQLLKKGEIKIYDIAQNSGFNSTAYYIKKFREAYGESPKEYIDKMIK